LKEICTNCKNFDEDNYGTCKAFPDGIPAIIASNEIDHTKPFKGDGGIRFEPIKVLKTGDSDE